MNLRRAPLEQRGYIHPWPACGPRRSSEFGQIPGPVPVIGVHFQPFIDSILATFGYCAEAGPSLGTCRRLPR